MPLCFAILGEILKSMEFWGFGVLRFWGYWMGEMYLKNNESLIK